MARSSCDTLVKTPRRIRSVVIFPNQRSTRFSHDEDVGMKWRWKRGCRASQSLTSCFLWVVGNAVDVERFGSAAVDGFEKLEKLLMAMVRHAAPDDLAFQYVERGEQGRRAVAFIVMRHGSGPSLLHRQAGLGAVKRLNLALFVDAEHQRVIGWVHIEANHILQLLDKIGIVRQLERLEQMRLQAVGMPDALHRRLADAAGLGHAAATPLRGVRRGALRPGDDLGCFGARQRRETPSARTVVIKRFDTAFGKAPPPIDYGRSRCVKFPGQRVVRLPSATPRMIWARNAMRCSVLPDRTSRSSSCLASRVTANAALLAHMLGSLTPTRRVL